MEMAANKSPKKLSQPLLQKLNTLVSQLPPPLMQWLVPHKKLIISVNPQSQSEQQISRTVSQLFSMTLHTFLKMLKMCGAKVINKETHIKISLPEIQEDKQFSWGALAGMEGSNRGKMNEEVSLQIGLRKNDLEIEAQILMKEEFMRNFSENIRRCNELCEQSVLSTLIAFKKNVFNEEQGLNDVTEIRDRLFDNQRELELCIEVFRNKLANYRSLEAIEEGLNERQQAQIDMEMEVKVEGSE